MTHAEINNYITGLMDYLILPDKTLTEREKAGIHAEIYAFTRMLNKKTA